MQFQGHATSHVFIFLHQIVYQKLVVITSFIAKKILNYCSKCLPCFCFSCSHFVFKFFTLQHKSNLWTSKNSSLLFSFRQKRKQGRNVLKTITPSLFIALINCLTRPSFICKIGNKIFSESINGSCFTF